MSRNICVCLSFMEDKHQKLMEETAAKAGFSIRFFTPAQQAEAMEYLQDCEILFGHNPDLLRAAPASLQWYCCAYAGVDPYCKDPTMFANPNCILTNSNCYGVTISEHVVMVLLMMMRKMTQYQQIVTERKWVNQLPIRSIRDSAITILGTGNIGINLAQRLRGMNAGKITGLSRSGRPVEGFDEVLPISALDEVLPSTSVLIMALPSTPETIGILSRERIAMLPEDALVINVGRGTAIDQEALAEALNTEKIAGAALDVVVPEPLPQDHFLWNTKNLILTPHISGNMTLGYTRDRTVGLFCENLISYASGQPMASVVDRTLGY